VTLHTIYERTILDIYNSTATSTGTKYPTTVPYRGVDGAFRIYQEFIWAKTLGPKDMEWQPRTGMKEYSSTTATWTTRPERGTESLGCINFQEESAQGGSRPITNIATAIQLGWHALLRSGATNQATPLHIVIILISHFVWIIFSIFREDHKRCLNRTREESRGMFGCLHLLRPGWMGPYNLRKKSI
jgi:hypothetical protein